MTFWASTVILKGKINSEERKVKNYLLSIIERSLKEFENHQINLASEQAREKLAEKVAEDLKGKFYLIPYASQESFE